MNCNDQLLFREIEKEPNAPEDQNLLQHLADCERCQQRMAELAATDDWWNEASSVLIETVDGSHDSQSVVVALDSNAATSAFDSDRNVDCAIECDQISLDFLASPSHPEMLGRLGRYEIERLIGAGGMGIVLKAFDTELHRVVAIKVLAPHLAHSGAARRRFAREAQAAAAVVNDNVVPIHNVETDGKLPYLVMQYVPGASLQARVDQNGPLTVDETLRIGAQIADGLAAAHQQGLIHRDVKPANILLEQDVDRVLISDFGLARAVDDASLTRSGIVAGTPHYMSPEQSRGAGIDCRSDLFGLGSVLYFMLTGRPPFRADGAMAVLNRICHDPHRPVCQVNSAVPREVSQLVDRLLEKDPARRVPTSEAASSELSRLLTMWRSPGGRRLMHRSKWLPNVRKLKSRHVAGAVSATVLLACLIAFVVSATKTSQSNVRASASNDSPAKTTPVIQKSFNAQPKAPASRSILAEVEPSGATVTPEGPSSTDDRNRSRRLRLGVKQVDAMAAEMTPFQSTQTQGSEWLTWQQFTSEIKTVENQLNALEQVWQPTSTAPPQEDRWLNEFYELDTQTRHLSGNTNLNGDEYERRN